MFIPGENKDAGEKLVIQNDYFLDPVVNKHNQNLENISLCILHKDWTCWKLCTGMSINWVYNTSAFHYSVFSWNTGPRKTPFCLKNSHSLPQKQITASYNRLSGWGKCSSFPFARSLLALFTPWGFLDTQSSGAHSAKCCGNMPWKK